VASSHKGEATRDLPPEPIPACTWHVMTLIEVAA